MRHTYDSLRELAAPAVVTPSLDAEASMIVLRDALIEAGVLIPWSSDREGRDPSESRHLAERWEESRSWRWALKAVYGAAKVVSDGEFLGQGADTDHNHRAWSELRIELRRRGVAFRGTMKRHEIDAALSLPTNW